MSIKCLMNGLEVNYPCSPVCALFGDCVTAFEAQKKENVRTNADRVRAMSDEKLTDFICNLHYDCCECSFESNDEVCKLAYWLKQPVKEEKND